MSIADRKIKNIDVRVKDSKGNLRTVNLIEHDKVNLKFKDPATSKIVQIETGEIIKIGVVTNNNGDSTAYLVIISYNYYLDNNIFNVPVNTLTQIITVNHSTEQYTITPVYTADESVALLRSEGNCLEFTINGKDWIKCGGGGGSDITIDDVDREIESYLTDYSTTAQIDEKISTATADFITEERATEIVDQATRDFVTITQVDEEIDTKTADFVTESTVTTIVDEKVAEATADFVTGDEVDQKISTATADFITEAQATEIIDQATRDFVTGAEVDTKISEATADFVTEDTVTTIVDEKVAEATSDFVTMDQVDEEIATKTSDFITEEQATQIIDQATRDFVTGAEVDTKISEATADFVTSEEVGTIVDEKISEATADFITGEQAEELIAEATTDFITEEQATQIVDQATRDFVTGAEVDTKISEATAEFVTGSEVDTKISEATADFVTGDQVDTKIADATRNFVTGGEVDEKIADQTANFVTMPEVDEEIDTKTAGLAPLESPTFTGTVTVPTVLQTVNDGTAASTSYVRTAISAVEQEMAGAFHFKGVLPDMEALEHIVDPKAGDVYQVTNAGSGRFNVEFVYTDDNGWVELGTVVDLSNYATLTNLNEKTAQTLQEANNYTDSAIAARDPYALTVAKGYTGTEDEFYTSLAQILNNIDVIASIISH